MISNLVIVSLSLYTLGTGIDSINIDHWFLVQSAAWNLQAPVVSRLIIESSIVLILMRTSKK